MHADKLGPLGKATVQELGWAQRDVISVPPEMAAIDAMRKMQGAGIGAVAVVSAGGKLIGNFSVSELRSVPQVFLTIPLAYDMLHCSATADTYFLCEKWDGANISVSI